MYISHCDGEWEHAFGVEIATLDNPGWRPMIDLTETELEAESLEEYRENYDDELDWMICGKVDAGMGQRSRPTVVPKNWRM